MLLRLAPNPPRRYGCRPNTPNRVFRAFLRCVRWQNPGRDPGAVPGRAARASAAERAAGGRGHPRHRRPGAAPATPGPLGEAERGGRPGHGGRCQRGSPLPSRETPAAAPAGTPRYGAFARRGRARTAPPRTLAPRAPRPAQQPLAAPALTTNPSSGRRSAAFSLEPLSTSSSSAVPAARSGASLRPDSPCPPQPSPRPTGPLSPQVSARSRLRAAARPQPPFSGSSPPGLPGQPRPAAASPPRRRRGTRCPPRRRGSPLGGGGARPEPRRKASAAGQPVEDRGASPPRRGKRKRRAAQQQQPSPPRPCLAPSRVYMHLAGLLLALEKKEKGQRRDHGSPSPAMCSVSEGSSTDPLVARFRQVEETLEKLHRENKSLKNKVPRYNAVCTLYHESAQQLKHLQQQLAAKEATIRQLRSSLARQQQPAAGGEAGAAGAEPSCSLVESLLEQLGQAREQLQHNERLSARRVEALSQVKPRTPATQRWQAAPRLPGRAPEEGQSVPLGSCVSALR